MKQILKMKQSGMTLEQIQNKLEPKISLSTISKMLRKFCLESGETYSKSKAGRKKINLNDLLIK